MQLSENKKPYHWKADLQAGFMVFLIALPLSLGISLASGFPPVAGLLTAFVGGALVGLLRTSALSIKGPAAGLIVIALGAVQELGQGDAWAGYRYALACIAVAGLIQVLLGWIKLGILSDFFPSATVRGMMAAIGILIVARQIYPLAGLEVHHSKPLLQIMHFPEQLAQAIPLVLGMGLISLLLLFGLPLIKNKWVKKIPLPLLVVVIAIAMAKQFNLDALQTQTSVPLRVQIPHDLWQALALPDFSRIGETLSWKYIALFAIIGTLETLLITQAVDTLDPWHRKTNMNHDLMATGAGNILCGMLGGLPMISEIVRSSANIDQGARSYKANVFHGLFMLLFIWFFPALIRQIPMTALSAILIFTGIKLASPKGFYQIYKTGFASFAAFMVTILITLGTDLLWGIVAGIFTMMFFHLLSGLPLNMVFKPYFTVNKNEKAIVVDVFHSAVFSNYMLLKKSLDRLPRRKHIIIDFSQTQLIDSTVREHLQRYRAEYEREGGVFELMHLGSIGNENLVNADKA